MAHENGERISKIAFHFIRAEHGINSWGIVFILHDNKIFKPQRISTESSHYINKTQTE